ncbi:hypothetical protein K437DRAFT_267942 [Tilletiaria anomala UBC 951]|uniref:rRNA-processing protein EFG1 n=1 Tax=Tilletiaria anomala (strain ATCC 24038 / CBS 436.72 / UBC 951) TaxID=1037660 RepID=A0A066W3N4_TILAU|nr:uncharacterized protein K437DRAFT_267942 [Tilletiaria anomala UBC 951]KDN47168.1 hypothetical protein K437DRAFT_267942 [Tilletiaria anomala UBC 951]
MTAAASSAAKPHLSINQVKSSLRQTKRLLAKSNLAENVKLEAERRLAALENDLEKAQGVQLEKKNAERYHKVKFFERRKLERRIGKSKKALTLASDTHAKEAAEVNLYNDRVLLNYVLNFPTSQKYVSLLLSAAEQVEAAGEQSDSKGAAGTSQAQSRALAAALAFKEEVEKRMEAGELPDQPEVALSERYKEKRLRAAEPESNHSAKRVNAIKGKSLAKGPHGQSLADAASNTTVSDADLNEDDVIPMVGGESDEHDSSNSESGIADDDRQRNVSSKQVESVVAASGAKPPRKRQRQRGSSDQASGASIPEVEPNSESAATVQGDGLRTSKPRRQRKRSAITGGGVEKGDMRTDKKATVQNAEHTVSDSVSDGKKRRRRGTTKERAKASEKVLQDDFFDI